jgi:hypothetical protein
MNKIKIKTIYGKLLTLTIIEQNSAFISGTDKFGVFAKIPLNEIENAIPFDEEVSTNV